MPSSGEVGGATERQSLLAPTADRKQALPANCRPLRREITAALWHLKSVNKRRLPRQTDFKRPFERCRRGDAKIRPYLA
jgi:hypothetical protein